MRGSVSILAVVLVTAHSLVAAERPPAPVPTHQRLQELVSRLGHSEWVIRDAAFEWLRAIGSDAEPALRQGLEHPNLEVRRASRRLLGDTLRRQYVARLKAFENQVGDADLAGWTRFGETVGRSAAARRLFVEMHRAEPALMISLAGAPAARAKALRSRFHDILHRLYYAQDPSLRAVPSVAQVAALLFAVTDADNQRVPGIAASGYWSGLLNQAAVRRAMRDAPQDLPLRRLFGLWVRTPAPPSLLTTKLQLATRFSIDEGLSLATSVARDTRRRPSYRSYAIATVALIGGPAHAKRLVPLLRDETVCVVNRTDQNQTTQIRDIALAWLIKLTKQNHLEYGMANVQRRLERMQRMRSVYSGLELFGFATRADRMRALRNWASWSEQHVLSAPPNIPPADDWVVAARPLLVRKPPIPERIIPRDVPRKLYRAERHIHDGSLDLAARQLVDLLANADVDAQFATRKRGLYGNLYEEAYRLLAELPASVRREAAIHHRVPARNTLDAAIQSRDPTALTRVAHRFPFTVAGREALYLMARIESDRNRPLEAALALLRLSRHPDLPARQQLHVEAELALAWHRAGLPNQERRARALRHALSTSSKPQPSKPLLAALHPLLDARPDGYLIFGGDARRSHDAEARIPYLRGLPLLKRTGPPTGAAFGTARLPSAHPLLVNDVLVFRTHQRLEAIDASSGKHRWQTHAPDRRKQLRSDRMWNHPRFGRISSNGELVFCLEDLPIPNNRGRHLTVNETGNLQMVGDLRETSNRLVAYDARTGCAKWESGPDLVSSTGSEFLGCPLPVADQLLVLVRSTNQTSLLTLAAENGQVTNRILLDDQPSRPGPMLRGPEVERRRRAVRSANVPLFANGVLVCPVSDRKFVAVDLQTQQILWTYEMEDSAQSRRESWLATSLAADDESVVIAAAPSDAVVCLHLRSGQRRWSASCRGGWFVGGVSGGRVVVVSADSVSILHMDDGRLSNSVLQLPRGARPSGHGCFGEGLYLLPLTTAEVLAVSVERGHLFARSQSPAGIVPGNLIGNKTAVFSQRGSEVWRFPPVAGTPHVVRGMSGPQSRQIEEARRQLYAGNVTEALRGLHALWRKAPNASVETVLLSAALQGLERDIEGCHAVAVELAARLPQEQTRELRSELAASYARREQFDVAVDLYTSLLEEWHSTTTLRTINARHQVQNRIWFGARLKTLLTNQDKSLHAPQSTTRIATWSRRRPDLAIRQLSWHPEVHELVLQQAQNGQRSWTFRERLLQQVITSSSGSRKDEAVNRWITLLQQRGLFQLAASVRRRLKRTDTEPVAIPAAVQQRSQATWPAGPVRVEKIPGRANALAAPLHTQPENAWGVVIGATLGGSSLQALDERGEQVWRVDRRQIQGSTRPFDGDRIQAASQGALTALWCGDAVVMVTAEGGGRVLWARSALPESPAERHRARARWQQDRRLPPDQRSQQIVLTPSRALFQIGATVIAADPVTGATLWTHRTDQAGSNLKVVGNQLLVFDEDAETGHLLDLMDGLDRGRVPLPDQGRIIGFANDLLLTWLAEAGRCRLSAWNLRAGALAWQRSFGPTRALARAEGAIGVLESSGHLVVLKLLDGSTSVDLDVSPPAECHGFAFERRGNRLILGFRSRKPHRTRQGRSTTIDETRIVDGVVRAYNTMTGAVEWTQEMHPSVWLPHVPQQLPVLVFWRPRLWLTASEPRENAGVICLDRRTGRVTPLSLRSLNGVPEVAGDWKTKTVEIRGQWAGRRLHFGE